MKTAVFLILNIWVKLRAYVCVCFFFGMLWIKVLRMCATGNYLWMFKNAYTLASFPTEYIKSGCGADEGVEGCICIK